MGLNPVGLGRAEVMKGMCYRYLGDVMALMHTDCFDFRRATSSFKAECS